MKKQLLKIISFVLVLSLLSGFAVPVFAVSTYEAVNIGTDVITDDSPCDEADPEPPADDTQKEDNPREPHSKESYIVVEVTDELPDAFIDRLFYFIKNGLPKTHRYLYTEDGEFVGEVEYDYGRSALYAVAKFINAVGKIIFG